MTTEPSDLAALLAALRAGDASAMQALYELYAPQLYRFSACSASATPRPRRRSCRRSSSRCGSGVRTFEYRGDAALVAWLHTIASHAVINQVRKRRRQPTVSLDAHGRLVAAAGHRYGTRGVRAALRCGRRSRSLSADQQQVVALRYVAGLTNAEAALVLGRSEGAIKALQHRALLRLHQCLTAEAATEPTR